MKTAGSPGGERAGIHTLQNALGKRPLSMSLMALCTSSLDAETPLAAYLSPPTAAPASALTEPDDAARLAAVAAARMPAARRTAPPRTPELSFQLQASCSADCMVRPVHPSFATCRGEGAAQQSDEPVMRAVRLRVEAFSRQSGFPSNTRSRSGLAPRGRVRGERAPAWNR